MRQALAGGHPGFEGLESQAQGVDVAESATSRQGCGGEGPQANAASEVQEAQAGSGVRHAERGELLLLGRIALGGRTEVGRICEGAEQRRQIGDGEVEASGQGRGQQGPEVGQRSGAVGAGQGTRAHAARAEQVRDPGWVRQQPVAQAGEVGADVGQGQVGLVTRSQLGSEDEARRPPGRPGPAAEAVQAFQPARFEGCQAGREHRILVEG